MSFSTDTTTLLAASDDLTAAVAALEAAALAHCAALDAAIASAKTDATALTVTSTPHEVLARSRATARGHILAMVNRLFPEANLAPAAGAMPSPTVADGKVVYLLTKGASGTP